MTGQLIALPYSPWSEKARWALDHHQIPYRESVYSPLFGMPLLRWKTKKFKGRLTVPIFIENGRVFTDSLEIARHAERFGSGQPLFPMDHETEIQTWNARCERCLSAGRALLLQRVGRNRQAQAEYLPPAIPATLRTWFGPVTAAVGMRHFRRKYRIQALPENELESRIASILVTLRGALGGGSPYILSGFSYADIVMAMVMQFVEPVSGDYIPIGTRGRSCWSSPNLTSRFADLVEWRDELYRRHRRAKIEVAGPSAKEDVRP